MVYWDFFIIKVTKVKIDVFFVDFADFAVFLPILDYVVFDVEFGGLPPPSDFLGT